MRNKISRRLILYFLIIVLANSIIAGAIFLYLGQKNYIDAYKENLVRRAENISRAISSNMDILSGQEVNFKENPGRGKNTPTTRGMKMSPRYIKWMNEVLDGEVWIIDKTDRNFQWGESNINISYDSLSVEEKKVIDQALEGEIVTSESFRHIFEEGSISVGAPLKNEEGLINGAILIHENIASMVDFIDSAKYILAISVLLGILLASVLVMVFANRFVSPINRIDAVAKEMMDGDYKVKTGIVQDDEIGELANNIDELAIRLEKSRIADKNLDKMRNDFISNISHELKTPVTVMKSSLEGLVSGVIEDDEIGEYHKVLYEEIGVLERLVLDLMELNSIKNTNFPMNFQEEDLISILRDAVRSQRILAAEKGLELKLDIEDDYYMMKCDYTRLRQMFIIVINNGIKYSNPEEDVLIRQFKSYGNIKVQVINKGIIIDKKDIDHLFVSFYRVKDTEEKGFGLGLAIAKEIANRHNVEIDVTGDKEMGTVFEFTFLGFN